jgi:YVTN family beta-propeller protein
VGSDGQSPSFSAFRTLSDARAPVVKTCMLAAFLAVVLGGGCDFGQSGIAPPADRVFLPAGIVADPDEDLVYVVNSNSDLRFNAGTIAAVDMAKARQFRAQATVNSPPPCTKTRFSRTEPVADDYCCVDLLDSNVINCNEPQFIQSDATVALGSFGSAIQLQRFVRDGEVVRRLFVAVRAEPSITFADVTVQNGRASIRCTGPRQGGPAPSPESYCDDNWRLRRPAGVTPGALVLPEEPHVLGLDDALGILYVGHLTVTANAEVQGGGVSTVDVCNPQSDNSVRFAGLARTAFLPATLSQSVAELSPSDPAQPATRIYATARYSAAISGMVLRDPSQAACDPSPSAPGRDLTLVPADSFFSSAFLPHGADIRGILFSTDGGKAYVLHRNDPETASNPAAIAVLDRSPLADGTPGNIPIAVLEVCGGPTAMQMHDAGRGDRIYVTCYDDSEIEVIDPVTLKVSAIVEVGAGPNSLVFSPRDPGIAYIAGFANSHISVIDLEPGSPTENHVILRVGLPHGYGE